MRPCGIARCEREHRFGFVIELDDRSLSHVGRICGKTKFGALWAAKRKAFRVAQKALDREDAIAQARSNLLALLEAPPAYDVTAAKHALELLRSFDDLPARLRVTLESRASGNDSKIVRGRYQTEDEAKREAFQRNQKHVTRRWIHEPIAHLQGLPGLRRPNRVDFILDQRLPSLEAEARRLLASPDGEAETFDQISRRLRAAHADIATTINHLATFFSTENLAAVSLLPAASQDGIRSVRLEGTRLVLEQ